MTAAEQLVDELRREYRWVRLSVSGYEDVVHIRNRQQEGWRPVEPRRVIGGLQLHYRLPPEPRYDEEIEEPDDENFEPFVESARQIADTLAEEALVAAEDAEPFVWRMISREERIRRDAEKQAERMAHPGAASFMSKYLASRP